MKVETILENGIIFKSSKDSNDNMQFLDAETVLQSVLKNARLVARSNFDLYQDENENRLIYVREDCRDDDLEGRVFLHVFPTDKAISPTADGNTGSDNLNFSFGGHILRLGGLCIAARNLPDYPIVRIRTGQFIRDQGDLWMSEFNLD